MTLDVNIATCGPDGIRRVAAMTLPRVEGVAYRVSWQRHEEAPIPAALDRPDITVTRRNDTGLSLNRNHGLADSMTDIILLADDDLHYTPSALRTVIDTFAADHSLQLALFRFTPAPAGKRYPLSDTDLSIPLPRGYYPSSVEMAFRRQAVIEAGLMFDPRLGLGAPRLTACEDEMFLFTALRKGLRCRFFPVTIARHDGPASTGTGLFTSPGTPRAMGYCIRRFYPLTWPLRLPLKAWRTARAGQMAFIPALRHLAEGALYSFRR